VAFILPLPFRPLALWSRPTATATVDNQHEKWGAAFSAECLKGQHEQAEKKKRALASYMANRHETFV
jgi:hypothetical protein